MDTTKTITHVGLCAGYGGIELGLRRVIKTLRSVALCEIEAFPIANLVAKMEAGLMDAAPIWTDLKTFPWSDFRDRVDILTGGYPCQPFSAAGKRLGKEDPRHLWPWIADGIRTMRPRVCFFENVEGHISLGLREVISELESIGYKATWGIFSAREVGAPHQRKRVFILAHLCSEGLERLRECCDTQGRQTPIGHLRGRSDVWVNQLANTSHSPDTTCGYAEADRLSSEHRPEICSGQSGRADATAWPSRPGEPQHEWEPPRVVGNSIDNGSHQCSKESRGEDSSSEQGWMQESEGGSASMGNSKTRRGGESGDETCERQGHRAARTGRSDDQLSQAQPSLGLHTNESPYLLGETLTLNPYGDSVIAYENISNKINARKVLFNVWRDAISQEIQWTTRGLQCLLAEKVLQSGMQLDSFTQRICYFVWCIQTGHKTQGWGLHGMWIYKTCGDSSQGQKPIEQFQRELGYAMCQLSYEIALARGQDFMEGKSILQGVREASERAWTLSEALPEMEEVWRSSLDQAVWENGCYVEATSIGNRTDELRLLGNGVVPATAERSFITLMDQLITQ